MGSQSQIGSEMLPRWKVWLGFVVILATIACVFGAVEEVTMMADLEDGLELNSQGAYDPNARKKFVKKALQKLDAAANYAKAVRKKIAVEKKQKVMAKKGAESSNKEKDPPKKKKKKKKKKKS